MKTNIEKIFFYFMLIVVSGSIGYAIKPEPVKENSNSSQIRECVQAMHMMSDASKKKLLHVNSKIKKTSSNRKDDEQLMNNLALFCFLYAEEFEHNQLNELISNFFNFRNI